MRQDLTLAWRALLEHKGFALAAIATFALGIGANALMFSVVYGVLLRPLPFPDADRLVRLSEVHPGANAPLRGAWLSNLTYYAWRNGARTIGPIATYGSRTSTVGLEVPTRVEGATVSPELFEVLQVIPAHGRFFFPADAEEGAAPVAVVSDGFWREQFGGQTSAIGRRLDLDGTPHAIIGVAPPGLTFPTPEVRFWTVSTLPRPGTGNNVRINISSAIARIVPGATAPQAAAEGTAAARREPRPFVAEMMFGKGGPVEVRAVAYAEEMTAGVRPALLVLMASVACLLLLACANVANLFLSRGVTRERDLAVRVALGAGRARLVRQLLTECYFIALVGSGLGLGLAAALMRVLPFVVPDDFPRVDAVHMDWRAVLFAAALSLVAGGLAGMAPALRGTRRDLLASLREGAGASSSVRTARLRRALLVVQAAIAVVLLVGSALLVRSFIRLVQVDPGYDAANVLTARIYLPGAAAGRAETDAFLAQLLPRLRAIPGTVAAGAGNMAPLGDSTAIAGFTLPLAGREPVTARGLAYWVTPGYAEALKLRLRTGRLLRDQDVTAPVQAMVVNDEFARIFLSGINPLGLQFPSILTKGATAEIVGIVGNVRKDGLDATWQPEVYIPLAHKYSLRREINLVVRTTADPAMHADAIRRVVRELRSDAAVDAMAPLTRQLSASVAQPRFAAAVLAGFASLALLLAAVGLYGVLSYTVFRRRRELGVRAALGASRTSLVALVFREGMTVIGAGLILGLAVAVGVTRLLSAMLFGVEPLDMISFAVGPALLTLVAVLVCLFPARRAAAIDPAIALRYE